MRFRLLALPATVAALLIGGGTAWADATQSVGQEAISGQLAQSLANSAQSGATNLGVPVSVLSPGAGTGSVTQANTSSANSEASNDNGTTQTVGQNQAATGGAGLGGALGAVQAAGQAALSGQAAVSGAASSQRNPSNVNVPIRILSPGDNGSVDQSNSSAATSHATNSNGTTQQSSQHQASGGAGLGGIVAPTQADGQLAVNTQGAGSVARSEQVDPSNRSVPIRILSPGGNGSVDQSNSSSAESGAANDNGTTQMAGQGQAAGVAARGALVDPVQAAGQAVLNRQAALSGAQSTQQDPSNINVPIRILSPGDNGSVTQSNTSSATSHAANGNGTTQTLTQGQAGWLFGIGGLPIQAAGQSAGNLQGARSEATSTQANPANVDLPIRMLSPGDNGSVIQTNGSFADSSATNDNRTSQSVAQFLGGPLLLI